MNIYRIKITTWTSSFRYPNVISGYQPTLKVPPLSTVLGLINASTGEYQQYSNLNVGYYFCYKCLAEDLETIYQIEAENNIPKMKTKSNVIKREFLFDCSLFVYLTDEKLARSFKTPHYQLLLGRSNDVATVEGPIDCHNLELVENASHIKGQIIPISKQQMPGILQPLPVYFTNEIPRRNIDTQPYSVIPFDFPDYPTNLPALRDVIDGNEIDIYMHHIEMDM